MTGARPELQGSYQNSIKPGYLKVEEDSKASWREPGRENSENIKLDYGDFKPAEKEMREASGIENYNFQFGDIFGIVSDDGENLYFLDNTGTGVDIFSKITEDQAAELGGCSVQPESQLTGFPLFRCGPWRPHISPPRSLHHSARGSGQTALGNWGPRYGQVHSCSTVG